MHSVFYDLKVLNVCVTILSFKTNTVYLCLLSLFYSLAEGFIIIDNIIF